MTLTNFIQLLVTGVAMGAIYTLTAKGLFIAHLTTNRVNFGQGDFLMAASFCCTSWADALTLPCRLSFSVLSSLYASDKLSSEA